MAKYVDSDELVDRPIFWTTFNDGAELINSLLRRLNIGLNCQITFRRWQMINDADVCMILATIRAIVSSG